MFVAADGTPTTEPVTVAAGTTKTVPACPPPAASIWVQVHSGAVSAAITASYADPAGALRAVAPI